MNTAPCFTGKRRCRIGCLHRAMVLDYYALRDAQAVRAENATGGHDTDLADYFGPDGPESRWTFKRHLIAYAGANAEPADVEAAA